MSAGNGSRRRALISLGLLAAAGIASWASSTFIAAAFPQRPLPADLILRALPYAAASPVSILFQYVADGAVTLAVVLLLIYLLPVRRERLAPAVAIMAIQYLIRAGINVLTPLANPHQQQLFGWFPLQYGMFPSGHTANVLLCLLLVDGRQAPKLKVALAVTAAVEMVALLLSRGHYSIDVVGGALLAYFVWAEWNRGHLFDGIKRFVEE